MATSKEPATRYWIGVASADHVARGVDGGFCQLCHGKSAPVRRLSPGDWIVYYSPRTGFRGGEPVQAFTAIGRVRPGDSYAFDMGGGFVPTRRDVEFARCRAAPIRPLIDRLAFIRDKRSWGQAFRRGIVAIDCADFKTIAAAMGIEPPATHST
jgi:hypothetical protein